MLALILTLPAQAQNTYATTTLQKTALTLGLRNLGSMSDGWHIINAKGTKVNVFKKDGRVESIGYPLFSEEMREMNPLPIYDYLEHAYLDHLVGIDPNPLLYNNIQFKQGNWNSFALINPDVDCSVDMVWDKMYSVTWKGKDGKAILKVIFPIDYERFGMVPRKELESNLVRDLSNFRCKPENMVQNVDKAQLTTQDGAIWVKKGSTYLKAVINDETYYTMNQKMQPVAIWSDKHKEQSVKNMLTLADSKFENIKVNIRVCMYDMTVKTINTRWVDLLAFCMSKGCKPYVGIESISDKEITAAVFTYNAGAGYDHVFRVTIPMDQLFKANCTIKARANLYSPSTNLKAR